MRVFKATPANPNPVPLYRGKVPRCVSIIESLRWSPNTWFAVPLSELPGGPSAEDKRATTTRQVRRYFRCQTLIEGDRLYVRRVYHRV